MSNVYVIFILWFSHPILLNHGIMISEMILL